MVRPPWNAAISAVPYPLLTHLPLVDVIPAGTEFLRSYASRPPINFNPGRGKPTRFAPLTVGANPLATMYAGATKSSALSESLFHDIPVRGSGRYLTESRLRGWNLHLIVCTRELRLARLRGSGLPRIGVTHGELVESPSSEYPYTAAWAEAVLDSAPGLDGLVWTSRQDSSAAAFLFIDVGDATTTYLPLGGPQPLESGSGRWLVDRLASEAAITIVRNHT
jgi:RES domain